MKHIKLVLKAKILLITILFASNTWALTSSSTAIFTEDWDPVTHNGIYNIDVTNTGESSIIYDFIVQTPVTPITGSDQTSVGWGTPWIGSDKIEWIADVGSEIMPGATLGGFSFTYNSESPLGSLFYQTIVWDFDNDSPGEPFPGSTESAVVPEPSSLLLMISGLIIFVTVYHREHRGHREK